MERMYPRQEWPHTTPEDVGMSSTSLNDARQVMDDSANGEPYRVVIVRHGQLVAEWNSGIDPQEKVWLASASKSVYSSLLGIAVEDGMIDSPDDKLSKYYPEALDVLPGEGPKDERHARHKDRAITLKQLLANTSGYLKPGEHPGEVKHYQTFGMNVLCHAIATRYGMWDSDRPPEKVGTVTKKLSGKSYEVYDTGDSDAPPGLSLLIDTRFRVPLRADWEYYIANFTGMPEYKLSNFGYYQGIQAHARDMARLGWLWCNWGKWENEQLIPETWLREAVQPVPAEREADPGERMNETYGLGFWTNREKVLWPSLPADSFAASGAGGIHIWVCPSRDIVVAQGPGTFDDQSELNDTVLPAVIDAITE